MSRHNYTEDYDFDPLAMGRWQGAVRSAIRGKRGQAFLKEALAALDAMPDKRLVAEHLVFEGIADDAVIVGGDVLADERGNPMPIGSVCLMGAVGKARGLDMADVDPEDTEGVAATLGIADAMAREIAYANDDLAPLETPEARWQRMRRWVVQHIID